MAQRRNIEGDALLHMRFDLVVQGHNHLFERTDPIRHGKKTRSAPDYSTIRPAEDGVTYIIGTWPDDAPNVAIVGDAIFAGSIGGARELADLAKRKILDQILSLPAATLICPGHGPLTTVEQEKQNNPFFP